jgi:hypothetical protein
LDVFPYKSYEMTVDALQRASLSYVPPFRKEIEMKLHTNLAALDAAIDAMDAVGTSPVLTIRSRVLDRLADALLELDIVLDLLEVSEAAALSWAAPHVRTAFEEINAVVKTLAD